MILVGNQRGGAKNLALHLLKEENEHVEVHEVRGFASHSLMAALNEAHAISRATRCKQFLFSLSLNPPKDENVSTETFEKAIEQAEEKLGLTGQPRAIVFHEKNGRRHCHTVWSRIKVDEMKAVQLSFTKRKLTELSRELYLEHGWAMPDGLKQSHACDPRNFTLAQWQQAKRIGTDPKQIKAVFQECWSLSATQSAFSHALKGHGYVLARGDRRGFVAVDHRGEVFAVSKWAGIKNKEVRSRLTDEQNLPSVDKARIQIAKDMTVRLDTLIFNQLEIRRSLQSRITRLQALKSYRLDELENDKSQYQAMREQRLEQLEIQRREQNRNRPQPRQRGPDWTR